MGATGRLELTYDWKYLTRATRDAGSEFERIVGEVAFLGKRNAEELNA